MMKYSNFYAFLREPLLHFLLIGGAMFLAYNLLNEPTPDNNQIVISQAQINHLQALWKKTRQRLPTQSELDSMVQQQIREEVLYREALAMGLDQNDNIIRRRLAQKMEFIASDLATLAEPTDTQLANYLETNSEQFEQAALIDFVQVFINPEQHVVDINDYTNNLLNDLEHEGSSADISTLGDPIMLDQYFEQQTEHGVSRLFGNDFARELFSLPTGSWRGPIQSGYGFHLVRIDSKTEAQLPELNAVRDKVHIEWLDQQRLDMDTVFYESLHQRYEIVVEEYDVNNTADEEQDEETKR